MKTEDIDKIIEAIKNHEVVGIRAFDYDMDKISLQDFYKT